MINEQDINDLWKSPEVKYFAKAAFEWKYGEKKQAYESSEMALYIMCIDDLPNQHMSIEQNVELFLPYQEWKKTVLSILTRLRSADTVLSEWVVELKMLLSSLKIPLLLFPSQSFKN